MYTSSHGRQDGYVQITLQELPHEENAVKVPIELTVKDTGKVSLVASLVALTLSVN